MGASQSLSNAMKGAATNDATLSALDPFDDDVMLQQQQQQQQPQQTQYLLSLLQSSSSTLSTTSPSSNTTTSNAMNSNSNSNWLQQYQVHRDHPHFSSCSGRMMKTYRLVRVPVIAQQQQPQPPPPLQRKGRHPQQQQPQQQQQQQQAYCAGGWAVAKAMWVSQQDLPKIQEQLQELQRLQQLANTNTTTTTTTTNNNNSNHHHGKKSLLPHFMPFVAWHIGSFRPVPGGAVVISSHHQHQQQQHESQQQLQIQQGQMQPTSLQQQQQQTSSPSPSPSSTSQPHPQQHPQQPQYPQPQFMAPIYLLRPYYYTTVSDRLASRPFLTHVEKVWITYQLLQALDEMHRQGVVHGFLTTENMALTSWNWLVLVDVASCTKPHVTLPDDDPSDYLYYFQEHHVLQSTTSTTTSATSAITSSSIPREKRCYLAPERFVSKQPSSSSSQQQQQQVTTANAASGSVTAASSKSSSSPSSSSSSSKTTPSSTTAIATTSASPPSLSSTTSSTLSASLTPAMDIFSAGCCILELFLNGERAMDLGDLMEYRRQHQQQQSHAAATATSNHTTTTTTMSSSSSLLQQRLQKVESSAIRAACRHMLHVNPQERLTAGEYLERLQQQQQPASSNTTTTSGGGGGSATAPTAVIPPCFTLLSQLLEQCTTMDATTITSPDERMALLAAHYEDVLWETMGIRRRKDGQRRRPFSSRTVNLDDNDDDDDVRFFQRILGTSTTTTRNNRHENHNIMETVEQTPPHTHDNDNDDDEETTRKHAKTPVAEQQQQQQPRVQSPTSTTASAQDLLLLQDTEALLKKLESLLDDDNHGDDDDNGDDNDNLLWMNDYDHKNTSWSSPTKAKSSKNSQTAVSKNIIPTNQQPQEETPAAAAAVRSNVSKEALIIYLQVVLSNIRHVQRPMSKLVGLQLLQRLAKYSSDEARLQRIVPTTICLLQDADALVRAFCIQVMTCTLTMIQTFPPSDSNMFSNYIFKRVSPLLNDPALIVRVAFAKCIASLAETALSFLDVTHAVRLYEAVGGATTTTTTTTGSGSGSGNMMTSGSNKASSTTTTAPGGETTTTKGEIFTDDLTKLLDSSSTSSSSISSQSTQKTCNNNNNNSNKGNAVTGTSKSKKPSPPSTLNKQQPLPHHATTATATASSLSSAAASNNNNNNNKVLIGTTYNTELAALHETVSRWVAQLTVDPSEHSSAPKRAILRDLARLCTFFGRDGVLSFILPQVLAFFNNRQDWELRASLLQALPLACCRMIGRASTQHFVLPCLETALGDAEEQVVVSALVCLAELLDLGLIARSTLIGETLLFLTTSSSALGDSESREDDTSKSLHKGNSSNGSMRRHAPHESGLFLKFCPFLLYPSSTIRQRAIAVVTKSCQAVGFPDAMVYLAPLLKSYLRFSPSMEHLTTKQGLEKCLYPSWTREELHEQMIKMGIHQPFHSSPTTGHWTSINVRDTPSGKPLDVDTHSAVPNINNAAADDEVASHNARLVEYIHALTPIRRHSVKLVDLQGGPQYLKSGLEGSLKLAQHGLIPRQEPLAGHPPTLPVWYSVLRDVAADEDSAVSELHAIRTVSELGSVFGLSIPNAAVAVNPGTGQEKDAMSEEEAREVLHSPESKIMESASVGQWGAQVKVDPRSVDTCLLVSKLKGLAVPPLPPKLGVAEDQDAMGYLHVEHHSSRDAREAVNWRPKVDTLLATASPAAGHSAPVVRLAVARDQRFFASASHDGKCRIWELQQVMDSSGILDCSVVYSNHATDALSSSSSSTCTFHHPPRVNDIAVIEASHSVVSGASDGSVHVWRVDMVSKSKHSPILSSDSGKSNERSRVSGTSVVRRLEPTEGEVLAVAHFNNPTASIVTFCSKGSIHTWDLRSAKEPFVLKHSPDIGYLTAMALGSDRHWIVSGTSRGIISLWDLRFQTPVKMWQHSRKRPINRLATWTGRGHQTGEARPFIFAASGPNECAMFDVTHNGSCQMCFRSIVSGVGIPSHPQQNGNSLIPTLQELPTSTKKRLVLGSQQHITAVHNTLSSEPSINAMVGSIGTGDNSYLITGGDDCQIRCWDFAVPTRCYTISGQLLARPMVERLDFGSSTRLMQMRHDPHESGYADRFRRRLFHDGSMMISGGNPIHNSASSSQRPENRHVDAIQDLKIVEMPVKSLLSCSRDGTIKVWR